MSKGPVRVHWQQQEDQQEGRFGQRCEAGCQECWVWQRTEPAGRSGGTGNGQEGPVNGIGVGRMGGGGIVLVFVSSGLAEPQGTLQSSSNDNSSFHL